MTLMLGKTRPARRAAWWGYSLLWLLLATLVSACATRAEVAEIVTRSNEALLGDPLALQPGGDWKALVERIESFINLHQGEGGLVHPLRLRQALILTVRRQPALAAHAFSLVDPSQLHTPRDQALFSLREHLIWWFQNSRTPHLDQQGREQARAALKAFALAGDKLERGSLLRHWIEEMRAWMALSLARSIVTDTHARKVQVGQLLAAALARYASILDATEQAVIQRRQGVGHLPLARLSRPFRAAPLFAAFARLAREQEVEPAWHPAWVRKYLLKGP